MKVIDFLAADCIVPSLEAKTKPAVLAELSAHMAKVVPGLEAESLRKVLEERELLASTAIGDGIAIPHGKLDSVGRLVGALGRAVDGIEFESIDGKPTYLIFMLVAPAAPRASTSRPWPGCRACFVTPTSASAFSPRPRARRCTRSSSRKTRSTEARARLQRRE